MSEKMKEVAAVLATTAIGVFFMYQFTNWLANGTLI